MFDDDVGIKAAQNADLPYLQQTYRRDTGEIMWDISAPVFVKGRHWGAFRIGFSMQETEGAISALRWKLIVAMVILVAVTVTAIKRLENRLIADHAKSIQEIIHGVTQSVKSFTEGVPQSDDITMLVLKFQGLAPNDQ